MDKKISKYLELLRSNEEVLLNYLRARFPVFHKSNFFLRDLQYGIRSFLEKKEIKVSYEQADILAKAIAKQFEDRQIFIKINDSSWTVMYPQFVTTEPGDPL